MGRVNYESVEVNPSDILYVFFVTCYNEKEGYLESFFGGLS